MSFLSCVRRTLVQRQLVARGMRVIVACSGGPDSAAMLFALARLAPELGLQLEAASVDHGLRPDAARDVAIAKAQAQAAGVPFHALRVHVEQGASLQSRAREARYGALLALARDRDMHRVATGHTRDDQAETVLMRLLRGAGVRGLSAVEPLRADGVMRPLLDASRQDAHAFALAHAPEIAWDSSNDNPRFERTRARQVLLPALRVEDPAIELHLARLADEARALSAWADEAAERALQDMLIAPESLSITALMALPEALRAAVLRAFLGRHLRPISGSQLRDTLEACGNGHGEVWLSAELAAVVESAGVLRVGRRTDSKSESSA